MAQNILIKLTPKAPLVSFISIIIVYRKYFIHMEALEKVNRPSKDDQKIAIESYDALSSILGQLKSKNPEIEIEESQERITIPLSALKLLGDILKVMSQGKPFSLVPIATEVTTQKAAEILGCSRPHLVKLLEEGKIDYTKVGKHRRVRLQDVMDYKREMKKRQKQHIIDIMKSDEEAGLYDS